MNIAKQTAISTLVEGHDLRHYAPATMGQPDDSQAESKNSSIVTYHCPEYPAGHVVPLHHHHRAQLLYAQAGIVTVTTQLGRWTVPPQQAVWIPAGVSHEVHMPAAVSMRSIYLRPDVALQVQRECSVVEVTPLLRELIARLIAGQHADLQQLQRLIAVLVDEVKQLRTPPLYLPAPRDLRLRHITDQLINNVADDRDLQTWSTTVGASTRTLARLFKKETGLGFREWRQQLRLLKAIEFLTLGHDVTSISLMLGYQSPSAFISMFNRALGTTPGQYLISVETTSSQQ